MNFKSLEEVFQAFNRLKILIIGDVMIDSYLWGKVDRISPEAPVPVVRVQKREKRLGGAANVALNIQAMGATPILCSTIGKDSDASNFMELLEDHHIQKHGVLMSNHRITTIKHRILSGSQHMMRIDSETDEPLEEPETAQLLDKIKKLMPSCQAVIFEDYDKGVITPGLIAEVITFAKDLGIPTVVDPKKRNFLHYHRASLFKPNMKELREGLKIEVEADDEAGLKAAIDTLKSKMDLASVLVTLSEKGMLFHYGNRHYLVPAHKREISDVSGAGDTVTSIAALALALGMPGEFIVSLANLGGGLVCEHLGVVPINKVDLFREAQAHKLLKARD